MIWILGIAFNSVAFLIEVGQVGVESGQGKRDEHFGTLTTYRGGREGT